MGRTTGYLTKEYPCAAGVAANRLVNWGAADGLVALAVDGTKPFVGVTSELATDAGDYASVFMNGNIAEVTFGGNVTRGDPLTADAQGRAILAAPAIHSTVYIVGYAECSGVAGDIGTVIVSPQTLTNPLQA